MMRFARRFGRGLVLGLPPLVAGLMFYHRPEWAGVRTFLLLSAGYSALAVLVLVLVWRSPVEVGAMARAVAGLEHDLWKQRMALQTQIEVLSAEREISLILREDVDFRAILEKVLKVVAGLVGPECTIEVHMRDELKAVWAEGRAWFDRGMVKHARLEGRLLLDLESGLSYDGEEIGRVRLKARLSGSHEDRAERGRLLESHFEELAGFVALAMKTPDLYTRAVEDGLTRLATKRHFLSQLEGMCEAGRRDGSPLSLIMIDIDHFKKINDRHGHLTGDHVLRGVADVLKKGIRARAGDAAYSGYRYGGEELSILLPRVALARAVQIAERIRRGIEAGPIAGVAVTASFGVAQFDPERMATSEEFIAEADAALYRAKDRGRNRVETGTARPATAKARASA